MTEHAGRWRPLDSNGRRPAAEAKSYSLLLICSAAHTLCIPKFAQRCPSIGVEGEGNVLRRTRVDRALWDALSARKDNKGRPEPGAPLRSAPVYDGAGPSDRNTNGQTPEREGGRGISN